MSRLFGCICNQPERLMLALEPVRDALRAPGVTSRWGLAYVQSDEVLLSRHPRAVENLDLFQALGDLKSDYLIGYAADDDGYAGNANTQPYRFRRWFFAQNGGMDFGAAVQRELLERLPGFLQRNVQGKAPAELVFHLFLSLLHDAGQIDDPNIDTTTTRLALRDAVQAVRALLDGGGYQGEGPGNIVVSNGRSMIAMRLGGPLYVRRLKQQEDPKRPDTEFKSVLVTSGEDNPGEGFEELPARSVLAIRRDVTTDISELDSSST